MGLKPAGHQKYLQDAIIMIIVITIIIIIIIIIITMMIMMMMMMMMTMTMTLMTMIIMMIAITLSSSRRARYMRDASIPHICRCRGLHACYDTRQCCCSFLLLAMTHSSWVTARFDMFESVIGSG